MSDAPSGGVLDTLRGLLVTGIALAKVRLELLSTEVREEKARLLAILAYGGAAIFLLAVGAVFLAVFLTVLLWDSHRLLALGVSTGCLLAAALWCATLAARHLYSGKPFLGNTRAEFEKDRQALTRGEP